MRKIMLFLSVLGMTFSLNAQIQTPQPSPFSKIEQKVGMTDVTLEYSRPNVRSRTVFGDLVPYGKVWRLGANENTKITFSTDVSVQGKDLKAGTYALFAIPNENNWDIVFYSSAQNWGAPQVLDESKIVAKVKAETYPLPIDIETFTMGFDDLSSTGATLGMMWANVYAGVKFEVPTDKIVAASIDRVMNGPKAGDYYAAAVYYFQEGKDINQAKTWIDKAMSMMPNPAFYQLRQQSLIYAKAGDKKGAIELAKKSLKASEEAGNPDYIKMNKDSLKEWGAK
ncbi:DUF2911 domain-containing protein [Gelidibacter maritimus]|uniref:DUF2911 domain-containing protein n=1 Tax=Gelidibacter maritimus TaxID=2761487 RepID=A0A7W2M4B6_9FLAO|nr:DUF2911 domain-containing protein [Gelidibacter maritimus]MBA6152433.1 DUF2911 domain-containing protein [Gelidibacter maritimus]